MNIAGVLVLALAAADAVEPVVVAPQLRSPDTGYSECYPASARRLGREGRLFVTVTINADGSLGDVEYPPGTEPWQEVIARCLFQKMQFAAGTRDGKPVTMQATLPVNFQLADQSGNLTPTSWPTIRSTPEEYAAALRDCYPAGSSATQESQYKITVGVDGWARNIEMLQSGGDAALDKAGQCVLRKLRFRPAQQGGMAVKSTITFPLKVEPPRR